MIKKKVAIAAVFGLSVIAAHAQNSGTYAEFGIGTAKYTEPGATVTPKVARVFIGQNLNENFDLEFMAATGLSDASTTFYGTKVTMKIDNVYGIYIKPKVKLSNDVELFTRVGYTTSNVTISALNYSASDTGSSMSYGAGVKFNIGNGSSITADYTSYYSKNGIDVNGVTVGYGFNF